MGFKDLFSRKKDEPQIEEQSDETPQFDQFDPLDSGSRGGHWPVAEEKVISFKSAADFKFATVEVGKDDPITIIDNGKAVIEGTAMDDSGTGYDSVHKLNQQSVGVPDGIANWFLSQGFIGYQMCALLAQHWLVDKACTMSVEDSIRNGWEIKTDAEDSLSDEQKTLIEDIDVNFKIKDNLVEMGRFTNVFGIRILIFVVESSDPKYYEKPYNPDGIKKGSYKGVSQIDPYWMTPVMTGASMQDPASQYFYDPEFWSVNGKKYHRSHLIICRGPATADLLKPTYLFGGIPLTQRIYERVYAAERTANEAPLLAMNKRTTAIHTDLDKMAANEAGFVKRLWQWVKFRDNHAVKVLGKEETMEQFDTSLADFDSVIMNQYQLVAAIAKTPATKILGTSPKGFNATGEFETVSYHEELESIQERWMTPMLNRHYEIALRSMGLNVGVKVIWEPVDSMTAGQQADINNKKVTDGVNLITAGAISPDEERQRLISDKDSGYHNLKQSDSANKEQGASPENIAAYAKAGEEAKATPPIKPVATKAPASTDEVPEEAGANTAQEALLNKLLDRLERIETAITPEGVDRIPTPVSMARGTTPSINGLNHSVAGIGQIVPALNPSKLPKVKINGMMVVVENPRGSIRQGEALDGVWQVKMPHHYGFIRGTVGADGEEIDAFIGPNPQSQLVFIVNQKDVNSGEFDEHKVMLGFDSMAEAQQAYIDSFSEGWSGLDTIVQMSIETFKTWISIATSTETAPTTPVVM